MTSLQAVLKPGDVLAVRGTALADEAIRVGQELDGKPGLDNHIAVMHHWTGDVPWGLEGKPGGVGWADLRGYITSPYTMDNCAQPGRDAKERDLLAKDAELMIGTSYDWAAIADDTLRAFHMGDLFAKTIDGTVPGHVVCSSYAAFLYERAGWERPMVPDRDCEPADWDALIMTRGWNVRLEA
ncbi:MAG TPA: hypothetical protein VGH57_16905 [Amycolatopsis sp.]|jgi:hypothetical protein